MGGAAMAWTEKMVEDLKIMWKQGLTTGEIGKRLGVSKNSIVGKVHRLQLDARPSPIKKKDEEQENAAVAATAETKPAVVKAKTEKKTEPREEKPAAAPQPVAEKPAVVRKNVAGDVKLTDLDTPAAGRSAIRRTKIFTFAAEKSASDRLTAKNTQLWPTSNPIKNKHSKLPASNRGVF